MALMSASVRWCRVGVARLRKEAAALKTLDVTFDVILTSPLTRANRPADVLAGGAVASPRACHPVDAPREFFAEPGEARRRSPCHCVGHEPDLGQLAARLMRAKARSIRRVRCST